MLDVKVDIPISKKHALASKGHSLQKGCLLEKPLEEEFKGTIVNGSGPRVVFQVSQVLQLCSMSEGLCQDRGFMHEASRPKQEAACCII